MISSGTMEGTEALLLLGNGIKFYPNWSPLTPPQWGERKSFFTTGEWERKYVLLKWSPLRLQIKP
jgi:hypothetical protein